VAQLSVATMPAPQLTAQLHGSEAVNHISVDVCPSYASLALFRHDKHLEIIGGKRVFAAEPADVAAEDVNLGKAGRLPHNHVARCRAEL
jgi:hypothetical protein